LRRHAGGIKALLLKRAMRAEVPSRQGPCELGPEMGEVRYFVAAKLPRYMHLCDQHYLRIRDALEEALTRILKEAMKQAEAGNRT